MKFEAFNALATPIADMPINEVLSRIAKLQQGLSSFWAKVDGWAPIEAAGLLSKSRLDWLASIAATLPTWVRAPPENLSDGERILAWANLGAAAEGALKLFFVPIVHDTTYEAHRQRRARQALPVHLRAFPG